MKYYLILDFSGWEVFMTYGDKYKYMDYPFVTTCLDVARGMMMKLRERNQNFVLLTNNSRPEEEVKLSDFIKNS